ncbi:MAG: ERAP1-like C-terminal domain-containing protein [Acidobacteria bacterium]|nr:ERAP1-like C-terminal domain-containing protein [Acidobacteriota bacterium]
MILRVIFIVMLLASACIVIYGVEEPSADPQPGVARDLARFRAAHYSNVRYGLHVELKPGADLMKGSEEIRVTLDGEVKELVLDWRTAQAKEGQARARVWDIVVNGREAKDVRQVNDHLIIPATYLVKGENVVRLNFESPISTSGSAVTRYIDREDKSEYIYTLFVPSDASTAFPCFDQPDLKARFKLEVTALKSWKVITNTQVEASNLTIADLSDNKPVSSPDDMNRMAFHETQPLSTYLFAFAAGPFIEFNEAENLPVSSTTAYPPIKSREELEALIKNAPTPMSLFVRKSKAERARKELPEVFRLHRECLAFLAAYFDFKYPFPKYDIVIVPEFAYGGMEHAGAIFLREERILFPTDPTANDYAARAELICHEAAHQWFGDLVTMRWFDDLWLKEGFATFMAYQAMEKILPQQNAWKVFYQRTKPGAYATDVTKGTTPIFQEIPNLSAAKSAYGNIVYLKAPSMLKQAEFFLGADKFQQGVRAFLKDHAFSNAEWADLVGALERSSGRKLDEWAAAWVRRRGLANVRASWSANRAGRIRSFTLSQTDVLRENGAWPMRLKLLLAYESSPPKMLTVTLDSAGETRVKEAVGLRRPSYVFANYEDYGYGLFLLDEQSRAFVLEHLGTVRDDFLRALLWGTLWDSVREAELAPSRYIELAIKLIPQERDEVTAQGILSRVGVAFNRYLSDEQRILLAPRLEEMLADRMMNAETSGLRITNFRAFQSIALTDEACATLKKILRDELKIPGMQLRSRDRFDIITALLIRDDKDAPALLDAQSKADTSDDARRYTYAAGAGRALVENKKKYFDAYINDPKLAESWIEASFGPLNAIQQSELTLPYLDPALRELPRLKRTRKIFFINGWLAAFIGGQCSEQAHGVVQDFLRRETALDRDLKLKVLEVTDGLERCVRIKSRYANEK